MSFHHSKIKLIDRNFSAKSRRQPILAYSTKRKNFSGINISQSILNTSDTPMNNKRKITGCTPTNKLIKRKLIKHFNSTKISFVEIDARQDLIQLKEENRILEEVRFNLKEISFHLILLFFLVKSKAALQLECVLVKKVC